MARVCFRRRGSAGGMEAIRGCALGGRAARNPAAPDSRRSILGTSRSRGGRSTAGSPARARCSAWEIGRSGRARSRKWQHAPHRAGRGEEARRAGAFLSARGFADCSSQTPTEPLKVIWLDQKERLRHYSLEVSCHRATASGARASDQPMPGLGLPWTFFRESRAPPVGWNHLLYQICWPVLA